MKQFKAFIVTVAHAHIAPCEYTVSAKSDSDAITQVLDMCHLRHRNDVKVTAKEVM